MTKIKKARLALGITATEAARRIGISRQRYSLYERGTYEANYEMLLRIAEVFGVTVDLLLNRESAPSELRRSALVGRVMSLSDEQVAALADALDQIAASGPALVDALGRISASGPAGAAGVAAGRQAAEDQWGAVESRTPQESKKSG